MVIGHYIYSQTIIPRILRVGFAVQIPFSRILARIHGQFMFLPQLQTPKVGKVQWSIPVSPLFDVDVINTQNDLFFISFYIYDQVRSSYI
jgi:hypothetical protein